MNAIDQLYLVAEISETILGFIAVFIALSKNDGRFSEADRHFIQALVLASAIAIVLGLTPTTLMNYYDEDLSWRYSLYIGMIAGLVMTLLMAWEQYNMSDQEAQSVHWFWHVPPWGTGGISFIVLGNAFLQDANFMAAYVTATTLFVPISLWCFTAIVFRKFF